MKKPPLRRDFSYETGWQNRMSDIIQCMTEPECWDFLNKWRNKPMTDEPRENLQESDLKWEYIYNSFPDLRLPTGVPLFRVHHGGGPEPVRADYEGFGEKSESLFEESHIKWEKEQDPSTIRFDRHWVSFTKDPMALLSTYFGEKGLRGFVVVISAEKNVDIADIPAWGSINAEQEVVAPMSISQKKEILTFRDFKRKYCKEIA